MKRVLAIIKFLFEGHGTNSRGASGISSILDQYELGGWSKCPVPEKKQIIEEDYSI